MEVFTFESYWHKYHLIANQPMLNKSQAEKEYKRAITGELRRKLHRNIPKYKNSNLKAYEAIRKELTHDKNNIQPSEKRSHVLYQKNIRASAINKVRQYLRNYIRKHRWALSKRHAQEVL